MLFRYLEDIEVSWSEGWRILQVVNVYVELVWDIHFPGKLTRTEDRAKERKKRKLRGKTFSRHCATLHQHKEEEMADRNKRFPKQKPLHATAPILLVRCRPELWRTLCQQQLNLHEPAQSFWEWMNERMFIQLTCACLHCILYYRVHCTTLHMWCSYIFTAGKISPNYWKFNIYFTFQNGSTSLMNDLLSEIVWILQI